MENKTNNTQSQENSPKSRILTITDCKDLEQVDLMGQCFVEALKLGLSQSVKK